jgi:hypothetical protein
LYVRENVDWYKRAYDKNIAMQFLATGMAENFLTIIGAISISRKVLFRVVA